MRGRLRGRQRARPPPPGRRGPPGGPARVRVLALLVGSGVPVVHRDDHDRRPTVRPVCSSAEDRAGVVCAPPRRPRRVLPQPCEPARNGSSARCRRSCWPTSTTSGARFTRAVARAPTAFPSPAVVWRAKAGCSRASAQPVARPTTGPRAVQARSGGPPGSRRGTGPRSSRGSRRPSSARARGGRRTSRPVPSSRVGQYLARRMFGMRTSVHMLDQGAARNPDYVQSLERGLAVIRAFGADNPDLRLSDVARHGPRGRGPALPADARPARVRAAGRRELLAPPAGARARLRLPLRAQPAGGRAAAHGDPGRRSERIVVGRRARRRGHRLRRPSRRSGS